MLAGARWYSPQLKRWVSRDPIRYEGGDNLYEYVEQNPARYIDISGQRPIDATDSNIIGIATVGGGIAGGTIGGAGGTLVIPGIGTISGVHGGAAIGATIGYGGGVLAVACRHMAMDIFDDIQRYLNPEN